MCISITDGLHFVPILTGLHKMDLIAANIDLEKAAGGSGQPPCSPNSQSTWESQNPTLNVPIVEEQITIDEDTDEESGKFRTIGLNINALNNLAKQCTGGNQHLASPDS